MVTQPVSYLPEDFSASAMMPLPGRYFIQSVVFVDDFDYGGTQDQQTAAKFTLQSEDGQKYEQYYGVGDKKRTWPIDEGQRLTGAPLTESCNFACLMDKSIKDAGLPRNRLMDGDGKAAEINSAFSGVWADWNAFLPPGRAKTRTGRDGTTQENRGIPVPVKFIMDGAATPPTPTAPATEAPPAPPATPPAAAATPPPPAAEPADFAAMLGIVQGMLANTETTNDRKQLMSDVYQQYPGSKVVAMEAVISAEFTAFLAGNGITLNGEEFALA